MWRNRLIIISLISYVSIYWFAQQKYKKDHSAQIKLNWNNSDIENQVWPNLSGCDHFVTKFAKLGSLPTQALASFPGSGNTWLRFLIESSTGIYTGSIFSDSGLEKAGHHGEKRPFNDGSTILQKTHMRFPDNSANININCPIKLRKEHVDAFEGGAVVIVRNPYKAIVSYWNLMQSHSHTEMAKNTSFKSSEFDEFLLQQAFRWYEVVEDWIKFGNDVYFMFYENIVEDPIQETRKLLNYLGLPLDESRLSCLSKENTGKAHRTKEQPSIPFKMNHHQIMTMMIKRADKIMKEQTGAGLPLEKYQEYKQFSECLE